MERFSTTFFFGGLFMFVMATAIMGVLPWVGLNKIPYKSIDEIAQVVPRDWYRLADSYPDAFARYYPQGPGPESFAEALRVAKRQYTAEACWHCHSQQIRPVSKETLRWGPVATPIEFQNEMHLPQLMGTRRVGPDLSREAGRRSNDWHVAHFYKPVNVAPLSVMPSYPWFYDEPTAPDAAPTPNKVGLALVGYMQWLGFEAQVPEEGGYISVD